MILMVLAITVITAFDFKCPGELERTFRAKFVCYNKTMVNRYSCLLDQDANVYNESCTDTADYVRPGQKYVTSGSRKNIDCYPLRYQPFKLWSNKSSQCVFKKSKCDDLGQLLNWTDSSLVDNTCRCDYTIGYAFVTQPRHKCVCIPAEEDCTCYKVPCPKHMHLDRDYNCGFRDDLSPVFSCPLINKTNVKPIASSVMKDTMDTEQILAINLLTRILVTCLITLGIILLTIMAGKEFRHFLFKDMIEECQNESKIRKISPEEAVQKLRFIIQLLEQLLSDTGFDQDFQKELSAVCPDYMDDWQKYKRDLLKDDCGIIIAGETSAGKTTLINQLVGKDIFYTCNLAATGTVCRILNSKTLSVKRYSENGIVEEDATDFDELASLIKQNTDIANHPPEKVDVYLPVPILKGNVCIVDTPGIGATGHADKLLLDCLPNAVSFVFIVNASNAGGIHKNGLLQILKTVIEQCKEMPCFEPNEVIFLTNKWDIIKNDKKYGDEEDQHTKTWNQIKDKLEESWPGFNTKRLFKISLEQVEKGQNTPLTAQFKTFQLMLAETIEKNKNKRVEYFFRFIQKFAVNAEMGIASRKHSLEVLDDDHKQTLLQNKVVVSQLERLARQKMIEAEEYKNRVIWQLSGKLSSYLHSDKGRTEILNPPERRRITSIPLCFLREEVFTRIHIGINRWCESKDVLIVIQEIQCKMTNLLSEIQLIIHNIEKDITGFARSIHDVSLSVFTRPELRRTLLNNGLALIEMITIPFLDDIPLVQRMIEKRAKTIYDRWLSTFSNTHIQRSFEENFGTEYDKVITRIFKNEIPIKVVLFNLTICKLLEELSDNKKKKESLTRLDELVQNINTQIEEFKEATNI